MGRVTRTAVVAGAATVLACMQALDLHPGALATGDEGGLMFDLPEASVNACTANTQSDALNCGRCGHVCAGGQPCSGGLCAPDLVAALKASEIVASHGTVAWNTAGQIYLRLAGADASTAALATPWPYTIDDQAFYYWPRSQVLGRLPFDSIGAEAGTTEAGIPLNVEVLADAATNANFATPVIDPVGQGLLLFNSNGVFRTLQVPGGSLVQLATTSAGAAVAGDAGVFMASNGSVMTLASVDRACDAACQATPLFATDPSACGVALVNGRLRWCETQLVDSVQLYAVALYEIGVDGTGYRLLNSNTLLETDFVGTPVHAGMLLVPHGVLVAFGGRLSLLPDDGSQVQLVLDLAAASIRALGADDAYYYFATTSGLYRLSQ